MPPISTFTAIDFETANHNANSICQVGLVHVVHGEVKSTLDILVQPPGNKYHFIFPGIHGITAKKTANASTFDKVWSQIRPFIYRQNVVAHNKGFDFRVLQHTLNHYRLAQPIFTEYCTLKIYGAALDVLCEEYNIELNHHDALSDAMACAKLFLMHLNSSKAL